MTKPDVTDNDTAPSDSTERSVGDVVETAGETTAAAMISGPADTRPVGADTLAKVDDTRRQAESEKD
ncbi:MAG: hypothetical protein H0W99_02520 [Acidobacteria bacterium]|nr:hypothetical protein [Acidobacteriota bacterium]